MKKIIACISIICYTLLCYSQNQTTDNNYRTQKNISYLHPGEKDSYKLERCKLDLHYPTDKKGFATLIWFHGGGLEAGEKHFDFEERVKLINPRITAEGYKIGTRGFTNYILHADDMVKA